MPSLTTYHPYAQSPSALTKYLKQKLHLQRAKCLSHSHSTQVEQDIPLERNMAVHGWVYLSICRRLRQVSAL